MSELKTLVSRWRRLEAQGENFLLATVVRTQGSSYRHAGARLIIDRDGIGTGSVSGGCLETDLQRRGWWRTDGGGPVVVSYDSRPELDDDDIGWGLGLGCQGVVSLLLERIHERMPVHPLRFLGQCLADEQSGAMATVFTSDRPDVPVGSRLTLDGQGKTTDNIANPDLRSALAGAVDHALATGQTQGHELSSPAASLEALIEVIVPPPHLWIFGAGPDAVPLLVAGRALGWTTSLCDSQVRWQTRQRFMRADHLHLGPIERAVAACGAGEQSFALVMSHDYERDREAVGALLATRTRYIGVLGPRLRTLRIFDDLQRTGRSTTEADLRRIHAPMGLDLGAETPEEIALAVVAEIQAIRSGARAGFLRDQSGRIHTTDRQVATAMATSPTEALLAQTT